ncbi:DUF1622 domain-containing protein [Candidatus Dependentiae bacterium]|nr:DUF1622 domain-containing protein [Candidatus Dependentiae bacterium]
MGVLVIVISSFRAIKLYFLRFTRHQGTVIGINQIRLELGYGITLGLEFAVAGDIIGSVAHPSYSELGILAIIVLIRTLLSYFLNKELQSLTQHDK